MWKSREDETYWWNQGRVCAAVAGMLLTIIGWHLTGHLSPWLSPRLFGGMACILGGLLFLIQAVLDDGAAEKARQRRRRAKYEHAVLRASMTENPLSVESAALASGLSLDSTAGLLRLLEVQGFTTGELNLDGVVQFRFRTPSAALPKTPRIEPRHAGLPTR